ncbi:MAG: hypothetical protein PHS04_05460 [Tissierellia bacterium]|nr:hypothetical protein [Tissierellia bacterium]
MLFFIMFVFINYKIAFMKKKLLIVVLLVLISKSISSQTESLEVSGPIHAGLDVGFSPDGYVPIGIHFSSYNTKFQFGLTFALSTKTGVIGEDYTGTINWSEYPEDFVSEGSYYTPFSIDIGYKLYKGLILGGGIGLSRETVYKNMFDDLHILGYNGSYHIRAKGENIPEYKGFITYYIPREYDKLGSLFIKLYYSKIMGPGASIGFTI